MNILRRATKLVLTLIAVAVAVILLGSLAGAQTAPCGPFTRVVELLGDKYQEQLMGEGRGPNGSRLMIFAHPDGNTWTVVGLFPDGRACIIASGADWSVHDIKPAGSET